MSLQPVVRLGDPGSHGSQMVSAATTVTVDGLPICRVGDTYACPPPPFRHGSNPLATGSASFFVEGRAVARINEDATSCGAVITGGSPTVRSS